MQIPLSEVPIEARRPAAQHLASVHGTEMASGADAAFLGDHKSDLATAVYQAVSAAGMSFPFPQREVRIISDQSSESTMVQAAGDDEKS